MSGMVVSSGLIAGSECCTRLYFVYGSAFPRYRFVRVIENWLFSRLGARFLTRILVRRPDSNRLRHLGSGVVIGAIGGRYAIVASAAHALQARWIEAAFGTNWGSKRS